MHSTIGPEGMPVGIAGPYQTQIGNEANIYRDKLPALEWVIPAASYAAYGIQEQASLPACVENVTYDDFKLYIHVNCPIDPISVLETLSWTDENNNPVTPTTDQLITVARNYGAEPVTDGSGQTYYLWGINAWGENSDFSWDIDQGSADEDAKQIRFTAITDASGSSITSNEITYTDLQNLLNYRGTSKAQQTQATKTPQPTETETATSEPAATVKVTATESAISTAEVSVQIQGNTVGATRIGGQAVEQYNQLTPDQLKIVEQWIEDNWQAEGTVVFLIGFLWFIGTRKSGGKHRHYHGPTHELNTPSTPEKGIGTLSPQQMQRLTDFHLEKNATKADMYLRSSVEDSSPLFGVEPLPTGHPERDALIGELVDEAQKGRERMKEKIRQGKTDEAKVEEQHVRTTLENIQNFLNGGKIHFLFQLFYDKRRPGERDWHNRIE